MILASIKDSGVIEKLHPLFPKAFAYLRQTDFTKLEDGRHEIEGGDLFANIQTISGKGPQEAKIETHKKYIDIQVPLVGVEQIGWKATADLAETAQPYDEEQDIAFFADRPTSVSRIYPGQFAVFFPEDGHAPGVGEGFIRKVIIKVKR